MLTRQQIFNRVVKGLASQDFKQSLQGTFCAFRGNNDRKCAIGWLIPDKLYSPPLEREPSDFLIKRLLPDTISKDDIDLTDNLRAAHDWGDSPADMKYRLRKVAETFSLKIPAILRIN